MRRDKSRFFKKTYRKYVRNFFILISFSLLILAGCQQKDSEQFVTIAHRGFSHIAPENTLVSIEKALESGADFAELDVRQTQDGEIVLMHDKTLDRTTNGTGEIWNFTLKELKQLDAGSWFGPQFKGEPIPTLLEVIQYVKGKMKLNIEIKISGEEPEIAQKVVDVVRSEGFVKECIVTSFDRDTVERIKKIAPEITTGFIFGEEYSPDVFQGHWDALSCNYKVVDEGFVLRARENSKKVYVWTVNDEKEMRRLIELKVDGIITNRPDLLKEVLN